MQEDQIIINAQHVNFAQAKGEKSIAQSGTGQSVVVGLQNGLQLGDLTNLINIQILEAINTYPLEKSRNVLKSHLDTAQAELTKEKPDKNLIEKSLESIKLCGEAIDGGEKIVDLCGKALPLLALLPSFF